MNSFWHLSNCTCSVECRTYRAALTREWRKRNPEKLKAQRDRYQARYSEELKAKNRARNQTEEFREYRRSWAAANPDKVARANRSASQARDPEKRRAVSRAWREANPDHNRALQRAWRHDREVVVNPRAAHRRQPWSEAEIQVALDPALSLVEAALLLGRTVYAISNQRYKRRAVTR